MADSVPSQIGRYEIVRPLGRGGMGVVYLARDPVIAREVAVKLLRAIDDEDAKSRFQREIRIAGGLNHPNVVRIYDAGEHDGQPFVAMEFVPGETVADLIKRRAPLDLAARLTLLLDLTLGLGFAHQRNIVHRDIKPSNLIVDEHDRLKILDFGIARLADAGRTSMSAIGTPSYMAPEQIRGEVVDARADLFACGVVVYEVIGLRQPFQGASHHALYHAILNTEPEDLTSVAPGTPASLNTFIRKALAKSPHDRFQSAEELGRALRTILDALTAAETVVIPMGPRFVPGPTPPPHVDSGSGGLGRGAPRSGPSKRLAELRDRQRNQAKEDARRALAEGRLADALEAAERALILDETDGGALELAELAREAMDRAEASRLLDEAAELIDRGELAEAEPLIERLRRVRPGAPEVLALETRLSEARRARQRAARVQVLLGEARSHYDLHDFDTALASVGEALTLDPGHDEAEALRAAIEARLAERRAEREWQERAHRAAAEARALAERGQLPEAIALLEGVSPAHPETTSLLGEFRLRHTQIVEQRRREAQEEQRQRDRVAGLAKATSLVDAGQAEAALEVLAGLRVQGFVDEAVETLEQRASDLKIALANERRRAAVLTRGLEAARQSLAERDPGSALLILEQLAADGFRSPDLDALTGDAQALLQQIAEERRQHLERERRKARLASGLEQVQASLRSRDAEGALVAVRFLRREGLECPELDAFERDAQQLLQELARQRQDEIERERRASRLAKGLADTKAALERRDPDDALAVLRLMRNDGLEAPEIEEAERQAQALQERVTRQRQDELERERRTTRLAQGLDEVRGALERHDAEAALASLRLMRNDGLDTPEMAVAEADALALQDQAIRGRQDALERERRSARLAKGVADVKGALDREDPDAAFAALRLLRNDGFGAADVAELETRARELQERATRQRQSHLEGERRGARLAKGLADVRAAVDLSDVDGVFAGLRLLREEGYDTPQMADLEARGRELQLEATRWRQEELERERRDARLVKTLADVRSMLLARNPDAALTALALLRRESFDPGTFADLEDEARALQTTVAREQIEQVERERREARLAKSLGDVRTAIAAGNPDAALATLDLLRRQGFDPGEFADLEEEARTLLAVLARERYEELERERHEAHVRRTLDDAREALDARNPDAALATLGLLRHDGIEHAELDALEERAKALQAGIAQERFERLEREGRAARLAKVLDDTRVALAARNPDAALAALGVLRREGFSPGEFGGLEDEARALQARLAREEHELLERERRAARLATALQEVRAALAARQPDEALAALGLLRRDGFAASAFEELEERARALQASLAQEQFESLERDRRASRLAKTLDEARRALVGRDADAALGAIGLLKRDGFDPAEFAPLEQEARALQSALAMARYEQLEAERRAARLADALVQVRAAIAGRDPDRALATLDLLRREGFDAHEFRELEGDARRVLDEVARERREELEHERREARLRDALAQVHASLEQRNPDAALAVIDLLRRDGLDAPELGALNEEAQSLQQAIARDQLLVLERERREARLQAGLGDIRAALDREDPDAATATLRLLTRDGFTTELAGLDQQIDALESRLARQRADALERERRAARLERDTGAIHSSLEREDGETALTLLTALEHDGLRLPDHESVRRRATTLRERQQREAAAAASQAVGPSAAPAPHTDPGAKRPARRPGRAVAVGGMLLLASGVAWVVLRPQPEPATPPAVGIVSPSPTSAGPSPGPSPGLSSPGLASPAPVPAAPPAPAATSPGGAALDESARLVERGDLRGAARVLSTVAAGSPRSPEGIAASSRLRALVAETRERAELARRRAQDANAASSPEFATGRDAAEAAATLAARTPEQAVGGYLDAVAAFGRAAASGRPPTPAEAPAASAQQTPTPREVAPALPTPTPVAPSGPATAAATPAAPAPAPPAAPSVDQGDVRQIESTVQRYFAARSHLDLAAVQAVYPTVPADREREAYKRAESACAEFDEQPLGIEVLRVSDSGVTVQARVQTNCKPRAGKPQPARIADIIVTLKKAGPTFQITQVNRPDQAR